MRPFLRVEGDTDHEFAYAEVHWRKEGRPIGARQDDHGMIC
jgi:hypothetical protein